MKTLPKNHKLISIAAVSFIVVILLACRSYNKAQKTALLNYCIGNMLLLDGAKEQWEMAKADSISNDDSVATNEVLEYIMATNMPVCPHDGESAYTLGKVGEDVSCSIHGTPYDFHLPDGSKP